MVVGKTQLGFNSGSLCLARMMQSVIAFCLTCVAHFSAQRGPTLRFHENVEGSLWILGPGLASTLPEAEIGAWILTFQPPGPGQGLGSYVARLMAWPPFFSLSSVLLSRLRRVYFDKPTFNATLVVKHLRTQFLRGGVTPALKRAEFLHQPDRTVQIIRFEQDV